MARIGAYTARGADKSKNEDSCCVKVATTAVGEIAMALVCDGVGGLGRGHLASWSVADRFAQWFERELPLYIQLNMRLGNIDMTGVRDEWTRLLNQCNDELYQLGVRQESQMGTSFTGILACRGVYVLAHVGDSRCYYVSPEESFPLTFDQTFVSREIAAGNMTFEEAQYHPKRNVVLQAVGAQNGLAPDVSMGTYDPGAMFVVCSDGLYRTLEAPEFHETFASVISAEDSVIAEACATCVNLAISRGELDDITVAALAMEAWAPQSVARAGAAPEEGTVLLGERDEDPFDEGEMPTTVLPGTGASASVEASGLETETNTLTGRAFGLMTTVDLAREVVEPSDEDDEGETEDVTEAGDE